MTYIDLRTKSGIAFDVREFGIGEALSCPFVVQATAMHDDPDVDFRDVVGSEASFSITTPRPEGAPDHRTYTGIISQLELLRSEPQGRGTSTWSVTLVPKLWLLSQRRNHRIYQYLSEVDIAAKLLREWEVEHSVRVDLAEYPARKYKVQYGESDYHFFARILEEAGVTWYFEPGPNGSRVVLVDRPAAAEPRAPIQFHDEPPDAARRDYVTRLQLHGRIRPNRYTLCDHDYRRPATFDLSSTAIAEDSADPPLERFHYVPGAFLFVTDSGEDTPAADDRGKARIVPRDGDRLAQRRLAAKRSAGRRLSFESNCLDLRPGVVFGVFGHPRAALNDPARHLVVRSQIHGAAGGAWSVACEATDAAFPYFPPLTTKRPRVTGVECATAVGPAGEEIATDDFGRVRVQFHWDREGQRDEESSCWIHVSQAWAGAAMGCVQLPRAGQEVLVEFLGGDPDRPIITGRVYTKTENVPYPLPECKSVTVIARTRTIGGDGYNEIKADDAPGSELLGVQAERDLQVLVKRQERRTVGQDQIERVGGNRTSSVGNTWAFQALPPPGRPNPWPSGFSWSNDQLKIEIGSSSITVTPGSIVISADTLELLGRNGAVLKSSAGPVDVAGTTRVDIQTSGGAVSIDGAPDVKLNCK